MWPFVAELVDAFGFFRYKLPETGGLWPLLVFLRFWLFFEQLFCEFLAFLAVFLSRVRSVELSPKPKMKEIGFNLLDVRKPN